MVAKANANIEAEASSTEQALPIGAVLSGDQFTITEHLGAGGFGKTYLAQDNVLGRTVVIKECFPDDFCIRDGYNVAARNEKLRVPLRSIIDMFMREAQAIAKLRHPNIVGVHRAFEENNTAYMALDLIDGPDLLSIVKTKSYPLSPGRIRDILLQLLDAVEKIHEIDLLHRDISPDNIILEMSGAPVLIDFGAARADASRRTRAMSSILVVKDGYSPHEFYVAGSEQSACSDLYALAATFYHVLSGEAPPHSQHRMMEMAGRKPDPCVPLVGRIDGYDDEFLQAIDQAMAIHPADRLQTAGRWKAMISDATSDALPLVQPRQRISSKNVDLELERSLARLVEETNATVEISQFIPVEPVEEPKQPEKVRQISWIEEFNRESEEPTGAAVYNFEAPGAKRVSEADDAAADRAEISVVSTARTDDPTNWIGRAFEKQDQERIARERDLELFLADAARPDEPIGGAPPAIEADENARAATHAPAPASRFQTVRIVAGLFFCISIFWLSVLN